jgi:hypothetical protein
MNYFQFDGSASFGATCSTTNSGSDFFYILDVEWDDLPGYDRYLISILNERGRLVNKNNIEIYNVYSEVVTDTIFGKGTDKLKFRFYKPVDLSYTFKIEAYHIGGKLSESFNF